MSHLVRVSHSEAVDDLLDALRDAHPEVRRRGPRTIVVCGDDDDLETELRFFVRAWALSRPAVTIVVESAPASR